MTTFNPNGNNWVNSDSMGKQLLMKAGWSKGEGIGKNKQGTNVHIKVSIKNEKDGIGFKSQKRQSDLSLMQCITFDNILKSKYGKPEINGAEEDELNQRGFSRARYGRAVPKEFFKPIESEELNKILCKSKLEKKEKIEEIPVINYTNSDINKNANFTSSYTVFEYFFMKMKNSKVKIKNFNGYYCEKTEAVENCEEKLNSNKRKTTNEDLCEVGVKRSKTTELISEKPDNTEMVSLNAVKKKEKVEINMFDELNSQKLSEISPKKKKKSKKNNENFAEIELTPEIQSTSPFSNEENTINETINSDISESTVQKSKKKSKSKNCNVTTEINSEFITAQTEAISKKKKRKIDLYNAKVSEEEFLPDNKEKKSKKSNNLEIDLSISNEIITEYVSPMKKNSVASVEIIENKTFCPWDSCNISAIEGYKYY